MQFAITTRRPLLIVIAAVAWSVMANANTPTVTTPTAAGCDQNGERTLMAPKIHQLCSELIAKPGLNAKTYAEAHYRRARARSELYDWTGAMNDFDIAIEADPNNPNYLRARAWRNFYHGDREEGQADLAKAIELDPTDPDNLTFKISWKLVPENEIHDLFEEALKTGRIRPTILKKRAEFLLKRNNLVGAEKDAREILTYSDSDLKELQSEFESGVRTDLKTATHFLLGRIYYAANEFAKAEIEYTKAVTDNPSVLTFYERAKFYSILPMSSRLPDRRMDALKDLKRATELGPDRSYAFDLLSEMLQRTQQLPEALTAIDQALELDPNNPKTPPLLWAKARLLRLTGQTEPAITTAVAAMSMGIEKGSTFPQWLIEKLEKYDYLGEADFTKRGFEAVNDGITACMHDNRCW
ncbi:MAG: tetratricopeptide repeat protein [Hyphomicrobiaceae bacterium]